jgi:hypothetical protein
MAKFNIDVDSSSKSVKISKDGTEINPDSFSISSYTCDTPDGKPSTCVCTSYSMDEGNGVSSRYSLHFDTNSDDSIDEGKDEYGMAKQVTKIHKMIKAATSLAKSLVNKK